MLELLFLFLLFSSFIFLVIYIKSSLKNKKLSKGWLKFLSGYMGIFLLYGMNWILQLYNSSPTDEDLGGLIILVIVVINLVSLLGLYLFYTLYYWHLNKNNNEVNYKKPFQIFLIVAFILGIFIYLLLF